METEVGDVEPSRLGYYNTKQLLQQIRKRNTYHARLTCTRIYDAHVQSVHWREAKMRMHIPSMCVVNVGNCYTASSYIMRFIFRLKDQ